MIDVNGMKIGVQKSWYNKTKVQDDGVTHIVDTQTRYPYYYVQITKNYFDTDMNTLLPEIISDLQKLVIKLQEIQKQENENIEKDENCR